VTNPRRKALEARWEVTETIMTTTQLSPFARAYVTAALWSTHDESTPQGGEPMDQNYSADDISPESLAIMAQEADAFALENAADLEAANIPEGETGCRAGFLFWLNRNGHGTGFWDEKTHRDPDSECAACDRLADAARKAGERWLYVGDDGKIYQS
jgi:hypothetical protein